MFPSVLDWLGHTRSMLRAGSAHFELLSANRLDLARWSGTLMAWLQTMAQVAPSLR